MANEIQRFYWGSQSSPVLSTDVEAGTFTLSFSGQTTSNLDAVGMTENVAAITAALEALSNIGAGNVNVSATDDGFTVEFLGSLANTNVATLTATLTNVRRRADTVNCHTDQLGSVDIATEPNNTTTTPAVTPVNEVQNVMFGGATSGSFDLSCAGYGSATISDLNFTDYGIQAACDTIFGYGNTVVGFGQVTFGGSLAATPIPEMTVTNNMTDGTPSVSTSFDGVAGVHQLDTCTFSNGAAQGGTWTFDGNTTAYNAGASNPSGATASGSAASGTVLTMWDDYNSHTPVAVAAGGSLLSFVGQVHRETITLADSPTEGQFKLALYGTYGSDVNYNATASSVAENVTNITAGAVTWTGEGSEGGPYTLTSSTHQPQVFAGDDAGSSAPLRKTLSSYQIVAEDGVSSGNRRRRFLCGA